MDPRIAQIVAREYPGATVIPTQSGALDRTDVVKARYPILESERLLRHKYGPAAFSPDPIAMVVVEHPNGMHETLVVDLVAQTVLAVSG